MPVIAYYIPLTFRKKTMLYNTIYIRNSEASFEYLAWELIIKS